MPFLRVQFSHARKGFKYKVQPKSGQSELPYSIFYQILESPINIDLFDSCSVLNPILDDNLTFWHFFDLMLNERV